MSLNLKHFVYLWALVPFTGWSGDDTRSSLFFDDAHVAEIHRARTGKKAAQNTATKEISYHLSGILYTSPSTWKLWMNGKAYSPARFPNLSVTRVSPTRASFLVRTQEGSHAFTLKINETYTAPG